MSACAVAECAEVAHRGRGLCLVHLRERDRARYQERRDTDPAYTERLRAAQRARYAADPARTAARLQARRERHAADPEAREALAQRRREQRASDPTASARALARRKERAAADPERARRESERARAKKYGLSVSALRLLLADGCVTCGAADDLTVDHDHSCCDRKGSCGACVRGALCGTCNRALGVALEDPDRLRALADYVERHGRLPISALT